MKKELLFIYGIISIKPVQDAIGPNLFALQRSTVVGEVQLTILSNL